VSFRNLFHEQISDPNAVVVVAEDERSPDEDNWVLEGQETIASDGGCGKPNRIVIGVCSWILQEGSERKGQFSCPDFNSPEPSLDRDADPRRVRLVDETKEAGEQKYINCSGLSNIRHPLIS
jgi:hypothetical protein